MLSNHELIELFLFSITTSKGYITSININKKLETVSVPFVLNLTLKQKCILQILLNRKSEFVKIEY